MRDISHLLLNPSLSCSDTEQNCPLLRLCPGCGHRFVSTRGRRQHSHTCPGERDPHIEAVQHEHLIKVHRIRQRRGR